MTAFDDLFDATLSTILHAGVEMFGGTKNWKTGLSLTLGEESEKSLMISRFPAPKKRQNNPSDLSFRDFFEESSASLRKIRH
ncbi:hypothetical protein [Rhizobium leguminosarum]|uniref:hypothetical protein n=1 Tax=Rhizobium leguminosarum TaxID=384 RepID=UPI001FD94E3F|nr:hypothetical protein [Rhizobium leguminosarum]